MPYCRLGPLTCTLAMVVARPHRDGERDANLHARSARRAPRSGARRSLRWSPPAARQTTGSATSSPIRAHGRPFFWAWRPPGSAVLVDPVRPFPL